MEFFLTIQMDGTESFFVKEYITNKFDHEVRYDYKYTFLPKGTIKKMGYNLIQGEVVKVN